MMGPASRVAVYYAPRPEDPLFAKAATWLGRDPESDMPVPQPDLPQIAEITAEPRLYGFHATLKPPFRLAEGRTWDELLLAARTIAEQLAPFALPDLQVADLHGFLALRETRASSGLHNLADVCVAELDPFRALPGAMEMERRRRAQLTPQQEDMLQRWGYPYVFETWFFHMTLTRRLAEEERRIFRPAAERYFAEVAVMPRVVGDLCLFVQHGPGATFVIAERLPLRG
jgi:putative phosphonate metabolism protein